ncbi:MAG: ABC transporter permease [Bifidobacteriaceae bacterium]|jgi:ABC-2 type transport system permease protein|nr:ABC transporter permease [Bifidobacteriaceae bacterium]
MTAATYVPPALAHRVRPTYKLTFAGALASEWVKLRSMRFTWWCAALQVLLGTGFAALAGYAVGEMTLSDAIAQGGPGGLPVTLANQGTALIGTVIFTVIGVQAVTTEYSGGSIKSTFAADPRRGAVLGAKALVVGLFTAVLGVIAEVLAIAAVAPSLAASPVGFEMAPAAWGAAAGAVIYAVVVALFGIGLGFLLRSAAGAIALGLGLFMFLDMLLTLGSDYRVVQIIRELLPSGAGPLIYSGPTPGGPSWLGGFWGGLACLLVWLALALGGAYAVLKKRDA